MKSKLRLALELERLRRKSYQKSHPLQQLFWESTLRCNVRCRHCGSDCASDDQTPDMPLADFLRVIDEEVTPHVNPHETMIIISGGEPLMRTDLEEIGRALYEREYPWGFVTNGLALTEKCFRALRAVGLSSMSVSLDGLEDNHVWLRRHPLAYEGAIRAIHLAVEDGMTFDVVTCVHRRNIGQLDAMRDKLVEMGVRQWRTVSIDPMGRAAEDDELVLNGAELRQLLDWICRQNESGGPIEVSYGCAGFLGNYEARVRNHLYQCAAGVTVASILSDGSISACTSVRGRYYQGNIYRDHFWEVWEHGFAPYRRREWMKKERIEGYEGTPCADCKMWRYCEGNGMHLRREDGTLMRCHYRDIQGD